MGYQVLSLIFLIQHSLQWEDLSREPAPGRINHEALRALRLKKTRTSLRCSSWSGRRPHMLATGSDLKAVFFLHVVLLLLVLVVAQLQNAGSTATGT
jgi:hypothetical protein